MIQNNRDFGPLRRGQINALPILYLLIFITGAGTTGTQILLYASVAEFYDLSVRSTGLGWASGMGHGAALAQSSAPC